MEKEQVFSVKIFFIDPIELIAVVINTLIDLEFESYIVSKDNKMKLMKILPENPRNAVFICVRKNIEVDKWITYIEELQLIKSTHITIGAFVYDNIEEKEQFKFLERGIGIIKFGDLKDNTVATLKNIMTIFEAKGIRKNIIINTYGQNTVYFNLKNVKDQVTGHIIDISISAFTCKIRDIELYKFHFSQNSYIDKVTLVLQGMRLTTSVKTIGYQRNNPAVYIFKFCLSLIEDNKQSYTVKISAENKKRIHTYIKKGLAKLIEDKLIKIE